MFTRTTLLISGALALGACSHGTGAHIDANLMQACGAFLAPKIIEAALEGDSPRALNVPAGSYRIGVDGFWKQVVKL